MRLVSTFSLQQAWRGQPQILELFVIPGEDGNGVRLVVNEIPYAGPSGGRSAVPGDGARPADRRHRAHFAPPIPGRIPSCSPTSWPTAVSPF